MVDPRVEILAKNIIGYSVKLKPGENILINCIGPADDLAAALIREAYKVGGRPFLQLEKPELERELKMGITAEQLKAMASWDSARMKEMQVYVGIRGADNSYEQSDVPGEKSSLWATLYSKPVHTDIRVPKTRWVVMRYPTPSMAQSAGMSTNAFEDFYFDVCNLDYSKMSRAMDALVDLMQRTDKVRLVGPGDTDLFFSIKGLPAIKCAGEINIPDGEVFTAPVKDSVNGVIAYNTPSPYQGIRFENIRLTFKNGKIVEATANDTKAVNKIFDTDEGARYVGEFSLGVNPYILKPMGDTLFDEKIAGSIHFTPGSSYDQAYNGNKSAIHWDLVMIQRPEYGGGEIWFDNHLIRKDGRFVVPELEALNPERLK